MLSGTGEQVFRKQMIHDIIGDAKGDELERIWKTTEGL